MHPTAKVSEEVRIERKFPPRKMRAQLSTPYADPDCHRQTDRQTKCGAVMPKVHSTRWQQVVEMEFGKQHSTTDTTDFCPLQLVTDLLRTGKLM